MRPPFHPILLLILIATYSLASAATLHVPADHPTIQSCIDAAISSQDECVVAPGAYNELINFLGKAITLRSSHGPDVTTIDGTGLNGGVVRCVSHEGADTVLDGLMIRGGIGTNVGNSVRYGGGMYNHNSSPTVINCTFHENSATSGGGMFNQTSSPTVINCRFTLNSANFSGGGMTNVDGSNPTVTNCTFSENTCRFGGGVFNDYSGLIISNCTFIGNTATSSGGGGMKSIGSSLTLANCTFSGNRTSSNGGGIFNQGGSASLTNCTFNGNSAYNGSAIDIDGNLTVTNCIFWGNSPNEIDYDQNSHPDIRFTNIAGGLPYEADDSGNIDAPPLYIRPASPGPDGKWDGVDDDYGDLRLQTGSPCLDTGDPNFVPAPGETDLDGHARVLCSRVDMGAYEFGIGDFDCDQSITLTDFAAVESCSTTAGAPYASGCEALDFEYDADVDLRDFAVWQNLLSH